MRSFAHISFTSAPMAPGVCITRLCGLAAIWTCVSEEEEKKDALFQYGEAFLLVYNIFW